MIRLFAALILVGVFFSWDYKTDFGATFHMLDVVSSKFESILTYR